MAFVIPPFHLEIQTPDHKQVAVLNVTDHHQQLSFPNILGAIAHFLPDPEGAASGGGGAFQYVDEDGDVITVRSQDETSTMLQTYFSTKYDRKVAAFRGSLVVFPYVPRPKSSVQRNIHGLKVSTVSSPGGAGGSGSGASSSTSISSVSPMVSGGVGGAGGGTSSGDVRMHAAGPSGGSTQLGSGGSEISASGAVGGNSSRLSGGMMPSSNIGAMSSTSGMISTNAGMTSSGSSGSGKRDPGDITQMLAGRLSIEELEYDSERDRLGSGNGGVVFRARHRRTGTVMALKRIRLDITEEKQSQIINELSILHRCHSPFIISFYGSFFHDNEIHIGTELMDGGSLDQYGLVREPVLGYTAVMVIHGLQYLWTQKIMHRDVKPSNMLVNSQGVVKLCDFGVSVQLVRSVTQTFCGTNAYMSPERLVGTAYRIESDIWSLGVSLYEMAMGALPFRYDAHRPLELISHIASGRAAELPTGGEFSDHLVQFVKQCLEKEPEARPDPRVLASHPFVRKFNESAGAGVVATWVQTRLREAQFKMQRRL